MAPAEEPPAPPEELAEPVSPKGLRVLGTGDLLTQLGRCCGPVPGDQ